MTTGFCILIVLYLIHVSAGANTEPLRFKVSFDAGRSVCDQLRVSNLQRYDSVLWKDADPDIPILKEAKAEYAKMQ